jgi:hypothetical protein
VNFLLKQELENGYTTGRAMHEFTSNAVKHKENLGSLINDYNQLNLWNRGLN